MPITALPTPPSRTDAANFNTRAEAFLGALPTFVTQANALAIETNGYATNAAASAATAVNAPGTSATSTTSLVVGTGSKSLTTQTGKAFVIGQWVTITSTASPANWMHGQITAYTSGTGALVVNVGMVGGSGTFAAWTVGLAAPSQGSSALVATGSYADPAWLTALAGSKITGTISVANGGTGATTPAAARTSLGLVIGSDVQAFNAVLTSWTGKAVPSGVVVGTTDTQTLSGKTLTSPAINGGAFNAASTVSEAGASTPQTRAGAPAQARAAAKAEARAGAPAEAKTRAPAEPEGGAGETGASQEAVASGAAARSGAAAGTPAGCRSTEDRHAGAGPSGPSGAGGIDRGILCAGNAAGGAFVERGHVVGRSRFRARFGRAGGREPDGAARRRKLGRQHAASLPDARPADGRPGRSAARRARRHRRTCHRRAPEALERLRPAGPDRDRNGATVALHAGHRRRPAGRRVVPRLEVGFPPERLTGPTPAQPRLQRGRIECRNGNLD